MFNFFKPNEQFLYNELLKENLDIKKIEKYLSKGIDLNHKDDKGKTILYHLVSKRKIDAIRLVLKYDVNLDSEDIYGKTVLDEAIEKNDSVMIRFLLENGSSVNRIKSSNRTVLQDVALEGNYKIFQILMKYNPDFDIKDSYGKTILFDAIEGENLDIIKEVVNNISSLNTLDQNNQTALFHAVLKENNSISKVLIQNGININFLDKLGQNVLFNAVLLGNGNLEIIELLLKKGIDVNIIDNDEKSLLDEILHIIDLQKNYKDLEGKYRLINEQREYLSVAHLLVQNGLNIDAQDFKGFTALFKQVQNRNFTNAKFLIQCGANINISDIKGETLLFKEVLKGYSNYQVIDFLIENGADIEKCDLDGKNIIDKLVEIIAIQKGFKKADPLFEQLISPEERYDTLLKKFLSYRPNLDAKRSDGKNILFDLVTYNDFETLKQIINYGVDLNTQDKKGNTPLAYMIEEGLKIEDKRQRELFIERLVFLLRFRVNVNLQDIDGRTVHHKAVIANDLAVVEKLLTKKADLSIRDRHGRTALHHTQWNGNYKIARWLIAAGADMNATDNSGFTLLNYAAIFAHIKLVITLIASGVLMYNKTPKNRKVARFFKQRESYLQSLLDNNISDDKMKRALEEVVENLKNEVNEALKG